jgi:hypothetical protein
MCRGGTADIALRRQERKRGHKLRGKQVDAFGVVAVAKSPTSAKSGQTVQCCPQGFGGRVCVRGVCDGRDRVPQLGEGGG